MPSRLVSVALSLALAGAVAAALAASAVPIAVQERPLVLPKRPAGADQPMNLPEDGAVKLPFVTGGSPGVEDFTQAHVFDLRDGREVVLGDLLTVEGFAAAGQGWPQEPARDPAMRTQR